MLTDGALALALDPTDTVSAAEWWRPENRVKGLAGLAGTRVRGNLLEIPDRVWENGLRLRKSAAELGYDPTTAQFLTLDPMVSTTRSPYAYVGDDPINGTDPSGKICLEFWDSNACDNPLTDTADAFVNSDVGAYADGWANSVTGGYLNVGLSVVSSGAAQNTSVMEQNWAYGPGELMGLATSLAVGGCILDGGGAADDAGATLTTQGGKTIEIPGDYVEGPTRSGGGTIYQPPGNAPGDLSNAYRVMPATGDYPNGYVIEYDQYGHPMDADGNVPQNRGDYHQPLAP